MKKLHKTIVINASREKVWDTMLGADTYSDWTKAFSPGSANFESTYKGTWEEGSKLLFIGNEGDGSEMGMVSYVRESRRPEFVSVEHVGIYRDGVEDTESEEAKKWSPAFENYTFTEVEGGTQVTIDQDIEDEYEAMFNDMWDKALVRLKELAET